ncbi:MAG: hypothetical protein BM564_04240 [Bacteroidetes bacterium MedPE-SWsnd-G2]|nr:MAG: hypothetical protein BM564_04240 [Bacteroidetes bacterium MedPE-SWsnd-G2]
MRKLVLISLLFICGLKYGLAQENQPNVIHVFVALCDNKNQGIVPVPEKLGNGQDPSSNLYWGALYGVKTFFKNSSNWNLVSSSKTTDFPILNRVVFKHVSSHTYIIADAYDGEFIKTCITSFLEAAAGNLKEETIKVDGQKLLLCQSNLVAYIGHDGLMEFDVEGNFDNENGINKDAIILACYSRSYFTPYLKRTKAKPLVWTTGLMAPEAYTLEASIETWISGGDATEIRESAASAYHNYQKCGLRGARGLLVTGF